MEEKEGEEVFIGFFENLEFWLGEGGGGNDGREWLAGGTWRISIDFWGDHH